MYTAVQAAGRQKHAPLNTYISLYANMSGQEDGEEREMINDIISQAEKNPEELLIDRENLELLEKAIDKELSGFEKQVLDLYLTGMKYTQIARCSAGTTSRRTMRCRELRTRSGGSCEGNAVEKRVRKRVDKRVYEKSSGRQTDGQGRIPPYALSCQLRQIDFLNIPGRPQSRTQSPALSSRRSLSGPYDL